MNCKTFESMAHEIAREDLMNSAEKTKGLIHAESCEHCRSILENQRYLSRWFAEVARADSNVSAKPSTEAVLLSAFRQQAQQPVTEPAGSLVAFPARSQRFHWTVAIAASLVAAFAASAMAFYVFESRSSGSGNSPRNQGIAVNPAPQGESNPGKEQQSASTPKGEDVDPTANDNPGQKQLATIYPVIGNAVKRPRAETTKPSSKLPKEEAYSDQEVVTDFIPVSYSSAMTPVESGRVMRIELPRSALASFGLPMGPGPASGRIKADVLVDEFGTARAIRFVQ
jgi:hypothetical protein